MTRSILTLLFCGWSCQALTLRAEIEANPIRKVVTILQDMQKELEAEGDKEKGLFEKFMCYCDGNTEGMTKSVEEAAHTITELKSKLEAEKAEKSQLDQELVQHKADRAAAKKDLETAASIRAKEHEDFLALTGDQKENLEAMTGALAALEKGMGSSFIQAPGKLASLVHMVRSTRTIDDFEKNEVVTMLQGKNPFGDYGAQSGEIVGMLKAMKDEMDGDLTGALSEEEAAARGFEELKAAKTSEIEASGAAIEAKTARAGALAVSVVTIADDIKDTTKEMEGTQEFVANLASQCALKKKEWGERQSMRAEEISAISEAIKILNDDDALDLFKKTMSLAQEPMRFIQSGTASGSLARARQLVGSLARTFKQPSLALLQYGLKAKAVDFTKIKAQIDGMVTVLGKEQVDDDEQKKFCTAELEKSAAQKAKAESSIEVSAASIEEMASDSEQLAAEIATLTGEIKELDKAVAEATEQRKEDHEQFLTFSTESNAALQLIEKAKNRLFKFYRPNLHKEQPKRELTEEERLEVAAGAADPRDAEVATFVQVAMLAAPPPPPDTWGAYQKKDEKSNGVIGLMEMLAKELQDDMTEAEHEEDAAQKDYERLMTDSQKSREEKVESITAKEAAKADLDVKLEATKETKTLQEADLANIKDTIAKLHATCDFLIDNYDVRKEARTQEIEGLKNAKSVLSGANFS